MDVYIKLQTCPTFGVHDISSTFLVCFDAKIDEIRPKIEKMRTINQIKSNRILLKNPPLQYKISLECKKLGKISLVFD